MATVITGGRDNIRQFHLYAQLSACKLELKGLRHSSGRSVIAHVKKTYGFKGNKESVVKQFAEALENSGAGNWHPLRILNSKEAEIATEFGDGTQFQAGEWVLHNAITGRYQKREAESSLS